ncbi:efflux RND transporter permease subunit [Candidatus Nanohalovita haloferacivicina]|uniref:efflux RND transporter permease subunit n=1 Tax=Candidatus Nanohalovita haloferacivicina TaxID=2978046 RepID=UPI00325F9C6B|nr:Putative exporter of the RND superfamily [Candidatus Nanohalobia archaeon BNXNv]
MSQKMLDKLTHLQENHALEVVLFFLMLSLAMIPGMGRVETIVALENMMPASSEPVREFNNLRAEGLGKDSIAVQVTAGTSDEGVNSVSSPESREYIEGLSENIGDIYGVTEVYSPYQTGGLIDDRNRTAVIIAYTYVGDSGSSMERIFNEIEEQSSYHRPEGIETSVSGVPAVQQRLSSMVERDKNVTTAISLLLVFLITLGLFNGSLTSSLMPLVVVGLSVVWLYGTMGYLGIPLSTLAGSVAALVIGIGIDYSVHILNTYRFHRRDNTIGEALSEAVGETGVAIIATSITTIGAFMAFLSGKMPEMHRFGLIMSIGIAYSLIFSFFLLPSVFVLEEKIVKKIHESVKWRHDFK